MQSEVSTRSDQDAGLLDNIRNASGSPREMLEQLVSFYRQQQLPMELFEARKLLVRDQLGLPLVTESNEPIRDDETERQLEQGLLQACRESGEMLLRQGRVFEGWTYLRPVGDNELVRGLLAEVPITEDNCEEMQRVLLHEGVDVARGYQSVLDFQGTCNSITVYDQFVVQRSKADRQAAGACLLEHFYKELTDLVREDITSRDKAPGPNETLHEMLVARPWVLKEGGYHLDTTHLSATVRIASVLTDPDRLRKAWELTQYGRQLHHQFQYPGDEPFVDFYPAYSAYYAILLGENVDAGLKLFQRKALSVDPQQHGTGAIETYVDLLDRVGRPLEAIEFAVKHVPEDVAAATLVPQLIEIAQHADAVPSSEESSKDEAYEMIMDYCVDRGDALSLAIAKHSEMRKS